MITALSQTGIFFENSLLFCMFLVLLIIVLVVLLVFKYIQQRSLQEKCITQEKSLRRRLYEVRVLEGLNERFGYSLNVDEVLDAVVTSLNSLVPYSTVSYLLVDGKKLLFKFRLKEPVSRVYVDELKKKMVASLDELMPSMNAKKMPIEESLSGSFLEDEKNLPLGSYFNIPLTVGDAVAGVFNIASVETKFFDEPDVALLYKIIRNATEAIDRLHSVIEHEKGKLEAMVESMTDGVLMVARDFRILVINPAFKSLLGVDTADNVSIFDIVEILRKSFPFEDILSSVFDSGVAKTVSEVRVRDRYLQIMAVPVKSEGNRTLGVGVIARDQSKEHELSQLREDFTAMMIHELRSPLTVMLNTSELLIQESDRLSESKIHLLLEQIKSSTASLLAIVNDLLDVAKLESSNFEIVKAPNNLNKLLSEEVDNYSMLADSKGISMKIDLDGTLENFKFDYPRVTQVLNNLLSNAIKFTDKGDIVVKTEKHDGYVWVSVSDTGVGVPESKKSKLFNKFSQIRTITSTEEKGTGLGLVIAKGIVEAHGGKIWVEDNHPSGAKFVFTLPVK